MELAEFVLARIAEDEHEARWLGPCDCALEGFPLQHGLRCPERVLAECDAKRRIVARKPPLRAPDDVRDVWWDLVALLALPYADHPDYDEAWRP